MSRHQQDPLRPLTAAAETRLQQLCRCQAAPASQVAGAKAVLAVAAGETHRAAARQAGRVSGDAVSHLVARFNREGVAAVVPGHGGGPQMRYRARDENGSWHEPGARARRTSPAHEPGARRIGRKTAPPPGR
jgi:hypothetical protein